MVKQEPRGPAVGRPLAAGPSKKNVTINKNTINTTYKQNTINNYFGAAVPAPPAPNPQPAAEQPAPAEQAEPAGHRAQEARLAPPGALR